MPASSPPVAPAVIEIEFATGARLRMTGPVERSTISALIVALAKPKRRR
jgi:hypothetical protein